MKRLEVLEAQLLLLHGLVSADQHQLPGTGTFGPQSDGTTNLRGADIGPQSDVKANLRCTDTAKPPSDSSSTAAKPSDQLLGNGTFGPQSEGLTNPLGSDTAKPQSNGEASREQTDLNTADAASATTASSSVPMLGTQNVGMTNPSGTNTTDRRAMATTSSSHKGKGIKSGQRKSASAAAPSPQHASDAAPSLQGTDSAGSIEAFKKWFLSADDAELDQFEEGRALKSARRPA